MVLSSFIEIGYDDMDFMTPMVRLEELSLDGDFEVDVSIIGNFTNLKKLVLKNGASLEKVTINNDSSLAKLTKLVTLDTSFGSAISRNEFSHLFRSLNQLRHLTIRNIGHLAEFSCVDLVNLETLNLESECKYGDRDSVNSLPESFRKLVNLKTLSLHDFKGHVDLSALQSLTSLKNLSLQYSFHGNYSFHDNSLVDLSGFPLLGLQKLKLPICGRLEDISGLSGMVELKELVMEHCYFVTDFSPLQNLTGMFFFKYISTH